MKRILNLIPVAIALAACNKESEQIKAAFNEQTPAMMTDKIEKTEAEWKAMRFPYAEISWNLQPPTDGLDGWLGITCNDPRGEGDGYVRNLLWQAYGRGRAAIR